jgi:tripartite-type tricarboxylate transporter receptor subunit TctC
MLPLIAQAQLTVITPFTAGSIVDVACRKLFDSYDMQNNTNTVTINMSGADQIVAHKHFITLTTNAVLCAGSGVGGMNQYNHPKISPAVNTLKPIIDVYTVGHAILTPVKGPNTIEDIIANSKRTGKSVLVGAPSTSAAIVLTHVLEKNNVKYEIIGYKTPTDAITSLVDGSLDTYVDGGSIKLLGDIKGIKEIAHVSIGLVRVSGSPNLYHKYKDLSNIVSRVAIYANTNTSDSDILLLNTKLNQAINSDQFQSFRKERLSFHTMTNGTVKQATQSVTNLENYLNVRN